MRSRDRVFRARRVSTSRAEEADEGTDRVDDALGTLDTVRARAPDRGRRLGW